MTPPSCSQVSTDVAAELLSTMSKLLDCKSLFLLPWISPKVPMRQKPCCCLWSHTQGWELVKYSRNGSHFLQENTLCHLTSEDLLNKGFLATSGYTHCMPELMHLPPSNLQSQYLTQWADMSYSFSSSQITMSTFPGQWVHVAYIPTMGTIISHSLLTE